MSLKFAKQCQLSYAPKCSCSGIGLAILNVSAVDDISAVSPVVLQMCSDLISQYILFLSYYYENGTDMFVRVVFFFFESGVLSCVGLR